MVEAEAPVDRLEQLVRIKTLPANHGRDEAILLHALVGRWRCVARDAGVHRCADAVDVTPRTEQFALVVMLGRGEARGVHRLQHRGVTGQGLPGSAKIDQHRRVAVAHVDVRRLQVEVQQAMRMDLTQAVEHLGEYVADEVLGHHRPIFLNQVLQRTPVLVLHDHVDGIVGTEEIEHPDDIGVREAGQGPPFFEETLHAVAEGRQVFFRNDRCRSSFAAQREGVGQILLDRDTLLFTVGRDVNDRKAAHGELMFDTVFVDLETGGKRVVRLLRHPCRGYH